MTSSSFSLYWRCLSESTQAEDKVVAVPHALDTPIYTAAKTSFISTLTAMFESKVVYASPANRSLAKTPKDFYMPNYEDVELTTADRKTIHCWLIKRTRDPRSFPTIIHFHGNACNISHMLYDALGMFQKVKANILLVDYRGYGLSHGSPSQEGLMLDAEAALSYCLQRKDVVNPDKIFLFGRSLGGAVAIALAAKHQSKLAGIVVENTFSSMDALVQQLSPAFSSVITRMTTNKWNSEAIIGLVHKPILFLAGRADEIVPCSMMTLLYRAAVNSEGRELAAFPKGKHNSTCLCRGYYETIKRFVDRVTTPTPGEDDGGNNAMPPHHHSNGGGEMGGASGHRVNGRVVTARGDGFAAATSLTLQ